MKGVSAMVRVRIRFSTKTKFELEILFFAEENELHWRAMRHEKSAKSYELSSQCVLELVRANALVEKALGGWIGLVNR